METLEEFQKLERTFAPRIKFVMSKEPCRFLIWGFWSQFGLSKYET